MLHSLETRGGKQAALGVHAQHSTAQCVCCSRQDSHLLLLLELRLALPLRLLRDNRCELRVAGLAQLPLEARRQGVAGLLLLLLRLLAELREQLAEPLRRLRQQQDKSSHACAETPRWSEDPQWAENPPWAEEPRF